MYDIILMHAHANALNPLHKN